MAISTRKTVLNVLIIRSIWIVQISPRIYSTKRSTICRVVCEYLHFQSQIPIKAVCRIYRSHNEDNRDRIDRYIVECEHVILARSVSNRLESFQLFSSPTASFVVTGPQRTPTVTRCKTTPLAHSSRRDGNVSNVWGIIVGEIRTWR